ncbi:oxidoreductase-like protein [Bimuria novae-zelandiae CBS 107.79]|uniref:Oxidoreductase-like protein n=1 Tax=Bimuria novae-zelandiae CBS 107.79 TaxID=1447943 RepID=A0A6A5UYJ9_9PLEO|nr:oxidoreductase-like protein [Bimuria novae-zelandiae CBS 107.79]
MSTRKAVVHKSEGVAEIRSDVPLPKLRDDYVIVKTKAVALNPTDWRSLYSRTSPGAIVGCDYSGIVEEVGKTVTTPFKKGEKVAGFIYGANPDNHDDGAFADYITAKGDLQIRISDNPFTQSLGLPLPPAKVREPTTVLIYGASTATGTLAVQYAKLSGLTVIATASPHNFELVKFLGADQVFDYKDPECGAKIREATKDSLKLAFDTISEKGSPAVCCAAISSKGGLYTSLLPVSDFPRDDVRNVATLAYTALGEKFSERFPANQNDFDFEVRFWRLSEDLINSGKIKTHPTEVREGGLEAIPQGIEDLKGGRVSGVKLVYRMK